MSRYVESRGSHPRGPTARVPALTVAVALALALAGWGCAEPEDRPASWSYVYATIITPNCITGNCHVTPVATAGLRLDSRAGAYTYLTGRACDPAVEADPDALPDHNFVVPFQPDSSKLMRLLRGEEVRSMPPDFALPDVEIEIIGRWILEGAECN